MLSPRDIATMLDHSILQPFLTEEDVRAGCAAALKHGTATVCGRPCDMPLVSALLAGSGVKPCVVIGFPHGSHKTGVKVYESERAIEDGCAELDMVINIGRIKMHDYAAAGEDVAAVAAVAHAGGALLKVILETCYLTDEEKTAACKLCEAAGADFVKTSTGYGSGGATVEDIRLMASSVSPRVRVKASGGIRDLDAVLAMRAAGASRCGASATEAIMAEALRRYESGILGADGGAR